VQAEAIIAAIIGAVGGGGGAGVLYRAFGPQRESEVATYYREVIKSLMDENLSQRKRIKQLLEETEHTHQRIEELQHAVSKVEAGDLPPEYS